MHFFHHIFCEKWSLLLSRMPTPYLKRFHRQTLQQFTLLLLITYLCHRSQRKCTFISMTTENENKKKCSKFFVIYFITRSRVVKTVYYGCLAHYEL